MRALSRPVTEAVVAAVLDARLPSVGFAVETGSLVVYEPGFSLSFGPDVRHAAHVAASAQKREV